MELYWIYICLGALGLILELVLPGAVASAFGLASLSIALGLFLGWVEGFSSSFLGCTFLAVVYSIALRAVLGQVGQGDSSRGEIDEDVQAFGSTALVLMKMDEVHEGRVRLQGSDWPALSREGEILKDEKVKVVGRENLVWLVERIDGQRSDP
jgi:inner membrane protein